MSFTFDKNYRNLEQVEEFLPAYMEVFHEVKRGEDFAYNDDFKGRIPGIAGECEDTAIYLLQGLRRDLDTRDKVARLLDDGYTRLTELAATTKYSRVVIYSDRNYHGPWCEYVDARVVPDNGTPYAVLRKGKRTHGTLIGGRHVLVRTVS